MCWNPLKNGDKSHNFFGHFINNKYCQHLKVVDFGKLP
jgi:hypothetical protein